MKRKVVWSVLVVAFIATTVAIGYVNHMSSYKKTLNINCKATLRYEHKDPAYVATIDMLLRLQNDNKGEVQLSGHIVHMAEVQNISRNIFFEYDVKDVEEIIIRNMTHVKSLRDTASDLFITHDFLYIPAGNSKVLRLSSLGNAWLIDNRQSPFAVCVDKVA